ncbi:MAG TPA: single-stranded-DNA-specific exonuclease RecJ [Gemmatimonadaceae bacterium]|nr:single-stranded-DNA-specific exonuclease RecJ [Gemmatimonadaceae bacterium]
MTPPDTRLRPRSRWVMPPDPDPDAVAALAEALRLPDAVCRLVVGRGYADPELAKRFLRPRLEHLHEPSTLLDLDRAVERLVQAIRAGETILVHGDYDVDGMCSTTIMVKTLRSLGGRAEPFIPQRLKDGYDLTDVGVRAALDIGARVVVTCDCGTSAVGPVTALQDAGVDVIITDHHLPGGPLPPAFAVINPKRAGCPSVDKDLAAVGVAFKLALALVRAFGASENRVLELLDLVALATVADIAPLRGENRVLVRYGLRLLSDTRNVGLRALIRAAGLDHKPLTAGRVGYILAPRLNAVGRLDRALRGVELLMTESEADANRLARDFEELNARRQEIDRRTLDEARRMVERLDLDATYGLVLAGEGWHAGVIGIVASRLVEEFGRPTILIALDGDEGKGSGRSISPFDLHAGIGECRDLLIRFGGHRAAAGVTIARDQVPAFAERFNAVARRSLSADDLVPEIRADLELPFDAATEDLEALLRHLEPFGAGNPAPVLVSRGVTLAGPPRTVGKDGLRLLLKSGGHSLTAIGWGMGPRRGELDVGRPVDVAFRLDRDEWNGESRLQARLADFQG